jgi:hypothetical protein
MRARKQLAVYITGLILTLSITRNSVSAETQQQPKEAILFQDKLKQDWRKNWFLDGENATLEHRDGGLAFITTASKLTKHEDRAAFDAEHAVLWTRQEFEGDIRIRYTFTKLPGCSWQKLIYVQAQGIGKGPYAEDIHAWRESRKVAVMSDYFQYMNLVSLSLRDQIRCKRYPTTNMEGEAHECEFKPRAEIKEMAIGREFDVIVEKRKESIMLRITDAETGVHAVDHTWDLTDEKVIKNMDKSYVEKGRIGIRLMGGHKILMRDFTVERL